MQGLKTFKIKPVIALDHTLLKQLYFYRHLSSKIFLFSKGYAKVTKALVKAEKKLGEIEKNVCYPEEYVEERAKGLQKNLDKWRETIMHKANNTKMRHLMEINKIDMQFQKMAMYYTWLVEGADMDSDYYQAMSLLGTRILLLPNNETTDFVEEFVGLILMTPLRDMLVITVLETR